MERFQTPILFLIFNRADLAELTFQRIKEVRPSRLFIAADGPRKAHPEDLVKCQQTRNIVISMIDWDCQVNTLFRDTNLGAGAAVSGAISWFFSLVEEGIILEDDCLPIPFFFQYAQTLLLRYRNHDRIMHISGNNFLTQIETPYDIFFSRYPHSWGWASWRNRWSLYAFDLPDSDSDFGPNGFNFLDTEAKKYWQDVFRKVKRGIINCWDYQWFHCLWRNNGISIIPKYNLVINIGFGENATNTTHQDSRFDQIVTKEFNLSRFPPTDEIFDFFDNEFFNHYLKKSFDLNFFIKNIFNR